MPSALTDDIAIILMAPFVLERLIGDVCHCNNATSGGRLDLYDRQQAAEKDSDEKLNEQ